VLEPHLHPQDVPAPSTWPPCYEVKFALARLLQPRSILEIGVRAGYSALAFLTACPEASYVGIDSNSDTHGGFHGALDHARELLAPFQTVVLEMTSANYGEQLGANPDPSGFDLVHVDGDHSLDGCLADLRLADRLQPRTILVDDVLGIPEVQSACDRFLEETSGRWLSLVIPDTHNGVRLLVTNPLASATVYGDQP
jgi:predicted O-methyltransferase YrrM